MLTIANIAVFIHEMRLGDAQLLDFVNKYAVVPGSFMSGEVPFPGKFISLFTSMFMHADILHLAGNMWFLWIFGDAVEGALGRFRFLFLYVVFGITASLIHILSAPALAIPTLGASGALSGVMGAFLVMFPLSRVRMLFLLIIYPIFFEIHAIILLGLWIAWQISSVWHAPVSETLASGGIAWWAHIGGFAAGFLTALFSGKKNKVKKRK